MNKGNYCQVPSSVSGHFQSWKRPNMVIVKRRYEHRGGTTSSKYISLSSFIQVVIYVVDVTVFATGTKKSAKDVV